MFGALSVSSSKFSYLIVPSFGTSVEFKFPGFESLSTIPAGFKLTSPMFGTFVPGAYLVEYPFTSTMFSLPTPIAEPETKSSSSRTQSSPSKVSFFTLNVKYTYAVWPAVRYLSSSPVTYRLSFPSIVVLVSDDTCSYLLVELAFTAYLPWFSPRFISIY